MAKAHKLPSGSWRCRACWTDEYGNYQQKGFTAPTKQEAEFLASQFLVEKKHSMKPENKTLNDLIKIMFASSDTFPFFALKVIKCFYLCEYNSCVIHSVIPPNY